MYRTLKENIALKGARALFEETTKRFYKLIPKSGRYEFILKFVETRENMLSNGNITWLKIK